MRSGTDYVPDKKPFQVEIHLADRGTLRGKLWLPANKSLADALNGPQTFIEFAPYGERRTYFLAKSQVISLAFAEVPKAPYLPERRGAVDANDPYKNLGVAPDATWYAVREAYLQLAKAYHPDRFSGVSLPVEVVDYLGAKARSINAAYATLEGSLKSTFNASNEQTDQFA